MVTGFGSLFNQIGFIGIAAIIGIATLFSRARSKINIRLVVSSLALQFLLAYIILRTSVGKQIFAFLAHGFQALYHFADQGAHFLFGNLVQTTGPWGAIFIVKALPAIIFFGALTSLLFHLGVVQMLVRGLAFCIRPVLQTSGAETLSVCANVMLGQTEAPLLIKNYLPSMTDSEMLLVMVGGMSHLSGSLLAVYGGMGVPIEHLLAASFMAIPGAILIAKILIPETGAPESRADACAVTLPRTTTNVLDAIAKGTTDGLALAVNVAAMLIAFIGLMSLANFLVLKISGSVFLGTPISLNELFGRLFYSVAYLIGIPQVEAVQAGALLGQKLVVNEFVAYASLVKSSLIDRSEIILTYALAGFSNFSCIGIQIGGIGAICPEKRALLTRLGLVALLGGTLTNLLNAAIVSLFI